MVRCAIIFSLALGVLLPPLGLTIPSSVLIRADAVIE